MKSVTHEPTTLRANTQDMTTTVCQEKGKEGNRRLSAQQSATSARQELDTFSILRDSQNYTTILEKHFNSQKMRGAKTYCSSACSLSLAQANRHLLHTITAMGIWASPSRLTYAAENSHQHHQTLDIHALFLREQKPV